MHYNLQQSGSGCRNCEDIAMSLLVSNATGASPIWVKGRMINFQISFSKTKSDYKIFNFSM